MMQRAVSNTHFFSFVVHWEYLVEKIINVVNVFRLQCNQLSITNQIGYSY